MARNCHILHMPVEWMNDLERLVPLMQFLVFWIPKGFYSHFIFHICKELQYIPHHKNFQNATIFQVPKTDRTSISLATPPHLCNRLITYPSVHQTVHLQTP
jgi:hypothetical protein